jgi:ribose transport system ATP-binding protein
VSGDRKKEGIFPNLSIFENLLIPLFRRTARAGKLALIDWRALRGVFDWEVERLAIRMGDRMDKITSLSGGNQQKALIGRAFALNPEILVLNDPARGVDVGAKGELYRHLTAFAARGKSVVYLSSEIEEFVGFCTRVIVFRHGHVITEFSGDEIDPDRILKAMFGQIRDRDRARRTAAMAAEEETEARYPPRMPTREDVGPIKVLEFGRGSGPAPRPGTDGSERRGAPKVPRERMKIIEFGKRPDK